MSADTAACMDDRRCHTMGSACRCAKVTRKSGRPLPLLQDECRGLFRWLAHRLGSRAAVRAALEKRHG